MSGHLAVRVAALAILLTPLVRADIIFSLGNTSPSFADGSHPGSATVLGQQSGSPAPFNAFCGSDASANCSTSWTFNYAVPVGQTVTGGTLTLGIYDIDSAATGDQVATYLLGTTDLASLLNAIANGLHSNTGSPNSEYNVLTISLPTDATTLTTLNSGSAAMTFALQAPGLGVLGPTAFNGAALLFSTLDLQTVSTASLPEPGSLPVVLAGLGAFFVARFPRRKARSPQSPLS